ncbi:MAG TPA: hypothetical protein VNK43_10085 [Gemmatimonadales bacterium]|nr:hypothetical protein [Gemmatimonadales bacterium]
MTDPGLPPDLAAMDTRLRGVTFEPRASLGPEIAGRWARGERGGMDGPPGPPRRLALTALAALVVAAGAWWAERRDPGATRMVDRCCHDLDGGGVADDGVLVVTRDGREVRRLRIYEDLDRNGAYSPGDPVRFERGPVPAIGRPAPERAVTFRHCCADYDGGGPPDDGLLVIGAPPDRVLMAAIYETADADETAGSPLR